MCHILCNITPKPFTGHIKARIRSNIMDVTIRVKGEKAISKFYDKKRLRKVVTQTLNRTGKVAKSASLQVIKRTYNLQSSRLKKEMTIVKAKNRSPVVVITAKGKPPGLQNYGLKGKMHTKSGTVAIGSKKGALFSKKGKGKVGKFPFTVEVFKGKRKTVKGQYGKGVFLMAGPTGGIGLFERTPENHKYKLQRLFGPDMKCLYKNAGYSMLIGTVDRRMKKIFTDALKHEFDKKVK